MMNNDMYRLLSIDIKVTEENVALEIFKILLTSSLHLNNEHFSLVSSEEIILTTESLTKIFMDRIITKLREK